MTITCCTDPNTNSRECGTSVADESSAPCCPKCESQSRPVSRKTVLLMLKADVLEKAIAEPYEFCASKNCPVVYFDSASDQVFTQDDLRIAVGVKAHTDPVTLCYCFGFDESHIRQEISHRGRTTIPERISSLIREGLCACEARNPSGVCCLGEVNRSAKRLMQEMSTSEKSSP